MTSRKQPGAWKLWRTLTLCGALLLSAYATSNESSDPEEDLSGGLSIVAIWAALQSQTPAASVEFTLAPDPIPYGNGPDFCPIASEDDWGQFITLSETGGVGVDFADTFLVQYFRADGQLDGSFDVPLVSFLDNCDSPENNRLAPNGSLCGEICHRDSTAGRARVDYTFTGTDDSGNPVNVTGSSQMLPFEPPP